MTDTSIYRDIAERTDGNVYIGVVGPVRCGKSTFIKQFMESVVLPHIPGEADRTRARDELPQSAGGLTVMTTEPKFIPDEGVSVRFGGEDDVTMRVKVIDCVGYMIPQALGGEENGTVRMVRTPWHADPIPFAEAAEYGTRKVITEHATVGILVTTDGTIGDIPREAYEEAEERVASELSELGKPFAVILNSAHPESEEAVELAVMLEEKYKAPVALVNCLELNADDFRHIFGMLSEEFPAKEADVIFPGWTAVLPDGHKLKSVIRDSVTAASAHMKRFRDIRESFTKTLSDSLVEALDTEPSIRVDEANAGEGRVVLNVGLPDALYYGVLSEMTGIPMKDEADLLEVLNGLSASKQELDKYLDAIREVNEKGYGIVLPEAENLALEEPEIIRQAGGYGVRLRASATSIHMIKTTIDTEISPIVGTEQQSEEMVSCLTKELDGDPNSIWESKLFGRTLYELINDGLHAKLDHLPEDARLKFGETLSKIINEGSQGLICIIL